MGNKLKDIFSDAPIDMGGNIRFESEDAYKKFLEALDIVWEEGKAVEVEGVSSISTKIKSGKFTSLDFDTIEDSKGKDYIIRVTTDCAPTDVRICTEPVGDKWAIRYGYRTWSLETMIVFDFLALLLVAFIVVLQKLFRK